MYALDEQRVAYFLHRDSDFGKSRHRVAGGLQVLDEAGAHPSVIAERVERRRRNRVDGINADELFDVKDVAIAGILGTRAGPQQPLCLSATVGQSLPAPAADQLLVTLVGELGICNRDLAGQGPQQALLLRIRRRVQPFCGNSIDRCIDPADEETGHAGHTPQVSSAGGKRLQPRHVRARHLFVRVLRKEQRDVDADALADQLLDRGNALWSGRDLDHQVVPPDRLP